MSPPRFIAATPRLRHSALIALARIRSTTGPVWRARHRALSVAAIAVVAEFAVAIPAHAGTDSVIGFDDLPAGTEVTSQYHALGVDLGSGRPAELAGAGPVVRTVPPAEAQSGDRIADVGHCTGEFCDRFARLVGAFDPAQPRRHVGLSVGDRHPTSKLSYPVELYAYDAVGAVVGHAGPVTVTPGAGFHTKLDIATASAVISSFELRGPAAPLWLGFDDLTFDKQASPPAPAPAAPAIVIDSPVPGSTLSADISAVHVTGKATVAGPAARFCVYAGTPGAPPPACTAKLAHDGGFDILVGGLSPGLNVIAAYVQDELGRAASASTYVTIPSVPSTLSVDGIDVMQGVQTPDPLPPRNLAAPATPQSYNGVRLVDGAKTIARVYASAGTIVGTPTATNVTAELRGYDQTTGKELPGGPLHAEEGARTLTPGGPGVTLTRRSNPSAAYTFTLPPNWQTRTLILRAHVAPALGGFGAPLDMCAGDCMLRRTLELRDIRFRVVQAWAVTPVKMIANGFPKPPPEPSPVFAATRKLFPGGEGKHGLMILPWWAGTIDLGNLATNKAITNKNTYIFSRVNDWASENPNSYGGLPGSMTIGVEPGVQNQGLEAMGKYQPVAQASMLRPISSVAHELFHGLGRPHASASCGAKGSEPWPPDEKGYLHGVGLDRAAGSGGSAGPYRLIHDGNPGQPPRWFDLMSYQSCLKTGFSNDAQSWISPHTWDAVVDTLVDKSGSTAAATAASAAARGARAPRAPTDASRRLLWVTGFADTRGAVELAIVKPNRGPVPNGGRSPYTLVASNTRGHVLSRVTMTASPLEDDNATGLSAAIPADGVTRLQVVRDDHVVASRTRSAHHPQAILQAPHVKRASIRVNWRATDRDHDGLLAKLDYSPDGKRHWRTVWSGPNRGHADLPNSVTPHSARAYLRLRINDGFNETAASSPRFTAPGTAPAIHIVDPGPDRITTSSTLHLRAEAFADDLRPLTGRHLRWYDGRRQLATGTELDIAGLTAGVHTLRVVARDRHGRTAVADRRLRVA